MRATAREIDATPSACRRALAVRRRTTKAGQVVPSRQPLRSPRRLNARPTRNRRASASIDIDLAAIIYTSGSTGEPRGVMLTHRNFVANARSIVSYLDLTERDRVMCVLPFYYVYGLSLLHTHLAVGGSVVIDNRFVYPNVVLRAMQEHAVTGFAGVPSTFALLLHRSELDSTPLPALRYVTQAGGAMPASRIQEWLARGPQVPFYVMYGATEASARLTFLDPARLRDKPGSIGKAIPNVEIRIVKDDGTIAAPHRDRRARRAWREHRAGLLEQPRRDAREVRPARLPHRRSRLCRRRRVSLPGGPASRHAEGWRASRRGEGDRGRPARSSPGVHEVAVVGMPHELLGEVPVAFVAMRDGGEARRRTLEAFCHARLPAHKVPRSSSSCRNCPSSGSRQDRQDDASGRWPSPCRQPRVSRAPVPRNVSSARRRAVAESQRQHPDVQPRAPHPPRARQRPAPNLSEPRDRRDRRWLYR